MAFVKLQIPDAPDVVFTTVLDNVAYDIRLHWNNRDESWYLFLGKQNTEYTFKTKITTNSDLLKVHRSNVNCPKGMLLVVDNMKKYGRISRDGWRSERFSLMYVPESDKDLLESLVDTIEQINYSVDTTEDTRFTKSATRL